MEMKCPTEQELGRLLEPDFDPDAAERIGAHLDACDRCRVRLDQIANASWKMVAPSAREGSGDVEETDGGSVLHRAMAGLIEKDRSPIKTGSTPKNGDLLLLGFLSFRI